MPVSADADGSTSIRSPDHVRNIFASQLISHVPVVNRQRLFGALFRVCHELISRELLIMRQSKDVNLANEVGVVYRGAVVDGLMQSIFFVGDRGVVDVD